MDHLLGDGTGVGEILVMACDSESGHLPRMNSTGRQSLTSILAALSVVTSAGAVFATSCCVLPLVLGGLGAGASVFAVLEALANYRSAILILSTGLVAFAWVCYFRGRGATSTAVALSLASLLIVTAATWDRFEQPLLRVIRTSNR
jgi:mercuric ion transport protein